MENQHLTYFKVENFKKFDSLEVKDIGQFNLIVGDNNVGKTCLLEALLIDENINNIGYNLTEVLKRRKLIREVDFDFAHDFATEYASLYQSMFSKNDFKPILFYFNSSLKIALTRESAWDKTLIKGFQEISFLNVLKNLNENSLENNLPFVAFNSTYEDDIYNLYNQLSTKRDKAHLIRTLKVLFPLITDVEYKTEFKQIFNTFIFAFEDKEEFIPLNYLGDGFKRIFYIILKVLSLKGKRIMIDEIETGIHYSRQKDFWINILKICTELDVQIFATTHSNECIQAFYKASKQLNEQKDIRLISLQVGEQEKIYSTTYNFENIEAGLYSNIELRA